MQEQPIDRNEYYSPQSVSNSKPQKTRVVFEYSRLVMHFKNCMHDGYFSQAMKREGPGITILDNGVVMLGNYKNDQNNGMTLVFLSPDTYFIGQFNKGSLDGPFVIRSPSLTLYSSFTNNKIQGQLLIIDYQHSVTQLWAVQGNGEGSISKQIDIAQIISNAYISYQHIKRIQNKSKTRYDKTKYISQESAIIKAMAPYIQQMPSLSDFVKSIKSGAQQFQGMGPQIYANKVYQNNEIIMLNSNTGQSNQFLAFAINKKQQLIAYGQFRQADNQQKINTKQKLLSYQYSYHLNGIGVCVQQNQSASTYATSADKRSKFIDAEKITYSGEFIDHQLYGEGCKHVEGDKAIYGRFVEGSIRNADVIKIGQLKDQQIKKMEMKRNKNIHIHSLKFYNNYCNQRPVFILQNLFQMMKAKEHHDQSLQN